MSFRQIKLVFAREYMSKIHSKGFILATILIPIGMIIFVGVIVGITILGMDNEFSIGIGDQTGQLYPRLAELNEGRYVDVSDLPADSLQAMISAEEIEGYILLNESHISAGTNPQLVYGGSGGLTLVGSVEDDLEEAIRAERLEQADVSEEVQQIYNDEINLSSVKLTDEGEVTEDNIGILSGIGFLMGIVIFIGLSGYGGMLARSVIEEKTSRIVEVIASSVKPIELLIGKMSGIAALGVTQICVWIIAGVGIAAAAAPVAGFFVGDAANMAQESGRAAASFDPSVLQIPSIEPMVFVYFILFFLLGYLLYSSFFAAIGAAVDSETDTQQFMFPIMVPIMLAYFIMFQTIQNPDSTLSVVSSLIPLFSPVIMITRIVISDVVFWQIGLSIILLIISYAAAMWLSAKIYQIGILSYGKSAGFKELVKWVRQ